MNADTLVKLVEKSGQTTNDIGEIVHQEKLRTIYAQRKYVRQSEFFQAQANGLKPECMLEVNSFEYHNEEFCYLENKRFKIYRAYEIKGTERTELYLTDVVGENNVFA